MEELPATHEGTVISTVSLDIIINEDYGDVSRVSVREYWLRGVRERAVGAIAGPPCESWSQSRGRECQVKDPNLRRRMPRVVRDRDHLWGRAVLALRELEQVKPVKVLRW